MPPAVATQITLHTLWQALTGQIPPLFLAPSAVAEAVLDSRDVAAGDLFIALLGRHTDGHHYVDQALQRGARAVICEERGRGHLLAAGALVVDCSPLQPLARTQFLPGQQPASTDLQLGFVVPDSLAALQQIGSFQRLHRSHPALRVVGVTGSVGKTSTKEMIAAVLSQHYRTLASPGNLNNEQGLPLTLLGLGVEHQRAVLEMGMYDVGEIRRLCELARPSIGVITNVGPSHLERLGTMERVAQAKAELVQALPAAGQGGVAVLNWDDEWVRPMAELTAARIFRYGLTPAADLWAEEIESAGMEGIRFVFKYRPPGSSKLDSLHVRVPLLGRHSVHTALRAAAVGLIEQMQWEEIVAGLQRISSQLRLVVVPGMNGATLIDDTYNASPASTVAALNLLADLTPESGGRRIAVLGDMRELGSYTAEGHRLVGRRAAAVTALLVTVGELGDDIGQEAALAGLPPSQLHAVIDADAAVALLQQLLQPHDLVLIKGSLAVGMGQIVARLSQPAQPEKRGEA